MAATTCRPSSSKRNAVRIAWGAVNGQVEQRRSLSLLACGAACRGRSARPGCALPDRCEAIRIAPQFKEAIHRRHRTGLAVISDNLLTVPQPAGLAFDHRELQRRGELMSFHSAQRMRR